jgi:hypothetical protein
LRPAGSQAAGAAAGSTVTFASLDA